MHSRKWNHLKKEQAETEGGKRLSLSDRNTVWRLNEEIAREERARRLVDATWTEGMRRQEPWHAGRVLGLVVVMSVFVLLSHC